MSGCGWGSGAALSVMTSPPGLRINLPEAEVLHQRRSTLATGCPIVNVFGMDDTILGIATRALRHNHGIAASCSVSTPLCVFLRNCRRLIRPLSAMLLPLVDKLLCV